MRGRRRLGRSGSVALSEAEVCCQAARVRRRRLRPVPGTWHVTDQYANNRIESDHARLKARLRPMRRLKTDRSARTVIRGHAFVQDLRRGHYELGTHDRPHLTVAAAFDELAGAI